MNIRQGILQTIEKKRRIYGNRIKHFGEPRVVTVGISNFCSSFKWHLFFDLDYDLDIYGRAYITAQIGNELVIVKTKHGIQLVDMKCRKLDEVKFFYNELKIQFPESDYYWSCPLFLRISEKVDENGKVISPAPDIFDKIPKEIVLNHFLDRKLYTTWD